MKKTYLGFIICFVGVFCSCTRPGQTARSSQSALDDDQTIRSETDFSGTDTGFLSETGDEIQQEIRFFGKPMSKEVAEVNERTLSESSSLLFDVLSDRSFTRTDVLSMIQSYKLPDGQYLGDRFLDQALKDLLHQNRNLDALDPGAYDQETAVKIEYGILVQNANVRAFPTSERLTSSGRAENDDLLQESVLPYASGVWILHHSEDGMFDFCVGETYFGWIQTEDIALTDRDTFRTYLSPDHFLVSFGTDEGFLYNRIGLILPVSEMLKDRYICELPERNAEGGLKKRSREILKTDDAYHLGFLPYSSDLVFRAAKRLIGTPYGWGDEYGLYDCSSFAGLIYRLFGYYLPRNSSLMRYFGGEIKDLSVCSESEKQSEIERHPGAVLVMPGHVMLYTGSCTGTDADVIHAVKGWYRIDGSLYEAYRIVGSSFSEMFGSDGNSFLGAVRFMLYIQ